MRLRHSTLALASAVALAGLVAGSAAPVQAAPLAPEAEMPPPPPHGHGAPPPPGAHVIVDRGPSGIVHVDVKCAERESTQDCASIATQMLDKLGADAKGH